MSMNLRPVLLRHVTGDRVAFAMGVRELMGDRDRVMFHVADGTRFKSARAPDGSKQRSLLDWVLADALWLGGEALHVVQRGDWFSVICLWKEGTFAGWHINFQRPLRPSPLGWDTEDLVLDIEVAPDGSWTLEDRDDFDHAVDEGYFDRETQHTVMNAVEDALARLGRREIPFVDDWTVPPALDRGPVALPEGWESLNS